MSLLDHRTHGPSIHFAGHMDSPALSATAFADRLPNHPSSTVAVWFAAYFVAVWAATYILGRLLRRLPFGGWPSHCGAVALIAGEIVGIVSRLLRTIPRPLSLAS